MLDSNDNDAVSLIYTLSEELTRRKISVYARPGNVPGALNINALKLLEKTGRFRPVDELAAMDHVLYLLRYVAHSEWAAALANPMVVDRSG